jgi:hypothetical protein
VSSLKNTFSLFGYIKLLVGSLLFSAAEHIHAQTGKEFCKLIQNPMSLINRCIFVKAEKQQQIQAYTITPRRYDPKLKSTAFALLTICSLCTFWLANCFTHAFTICRFKQG